VLCGDAPSAQVALATRRATLISSGNIAEQCVYTALTSRN